jgi:ferredoxin
MSRWQALHRWLALFVGLQLLLWIVSGLLLNLVDEEFFDANGHRQFSSPKALSQSFTSDEDEDENEAQSSALSISPLGALLATLPKQTFITVELLSLFNSPVYKIISQVSPGNVQTQRITHYYWADSLTPVMLSIKEIKQLAIQSYRADPQQLDSVKRIAEPTLLAQGDTGFNITEPVYQILVDDAAKTRIYINGASGDILGHKNSRSDLKDWLFILHFMDYNPGNGLSFNHFWIQGIALLSLLLGLSGTALLYKRITQGHFSLGWFSRLRPSKIRRIRAMQIHDAAGSHILELQIQSGMLIDTINHQQERIKTQCGGGGTCGLCAVRFIDSSPIANEADKAKLSKMKLEKGFRLSCQHSSQSCNTAAELNIALANKGQLKGFD